MVQNKNDVNEYEPLEVELESTAKTEGIIELLETTIEGIRKLKTTWYLKMELKEKIE